MAVSEHQHSVNPFYHYNPILLSLLLLLLLLLVFFIIIIIIIIITIKTAYPRALVLFPPLEYRIDVAFQE